MKVAEVTYTGTMRSMYARGYRFRSPSSTNRQSTAVDSVDDAEWFETQDVYDVEWSPQGKIARQIGDQVESAQEALEELGYRQKQRLVKAWEVNVKANAGEEELDEALKPVAEEMVEQMELE